MAEYDIHKNNEYKWTQETDSDVLASVPYIKLTEYENLTDTLVQQMIYQKKAYDIFGNQKNLNKAISTGSFTDVYKNLYQIKPTGTSFKLPYIKQEGYTLDTRYSQIDPKSNTIGASIQELWNNIHNFQYLIGDEWNTIKSLTTNDTETILERYSRIRRQGVQLAKQSIKGYSGSNFGEYSTTFNLLNETDDLAKSHLTFIQELMKKNTPAFISIMAIKVPYVYAIDISGLYRIPLGFISKFSARPKGNVILKGGAYVPDAWEVSMSFNSLIPISKQMLEMGFNNAKGAADAAKSAESVFLKKSNEPTSVTKGTEASSESTQRSPNAPTAYKRPDIEAIIARSPILSGGR